MPVEGIPVFIERLLNAALQDMSVSSFKVDGNGAQTVTVLRLSATTTTASIGHPTHTHDFNATYRRKCPSQVRRDRQRANQFRGKQKASDCFSYPRSPPSLFMSTPPCLQYSGDGRKDNSVFQQARCSPLCLSVRARDTREVSTQHIDLEPCESDARAVTLPLPLPVLESETDRTDVAEDSDDDCDNDCQQDVPDQISAEEADNTDEYQPGVSSADVDTSHATFSSVLQLMKEMKEELGKKFDGLNADIRQFNSTPTFDNS